MNFTFDGQKIEFQDGETVAAALLRAGIISWRTTRKSGRPRGVFCGICACYDCLLTVDNQRNQRSCLVPASEDSELSSTDPGLMK
ncbi:(2Fe-2S)-binding protein [Renibacterium salmoninarum]|uniref:(2Fe-2S)-binding protein n=1 Tax=Renibacterium salmoninarum TaxID=1646 RepID=UPI0003169238|nr:(2Fe-2S)-binding protein [Renibacterium salmoninarum]